VYVVGRGKAAFFGAEMWFVVKNERAFLLYPMHDSRPGQSLAHAVSLAAIVPLV
jgi:hypothetical protein